MPTCMPGFDAKLAVDIAQVVSALVALAGLLYTARVFRRQMNIQLFLAFTDRYVKTLDSFSPEAREARLKLDAKLPPPSPKLSKQILQYLTVCGEEYYLYRNGYLSKVLWKLWEPKIIGSLKSQLFIREWPALAHEFDDQAEFQAYVRDIQERKVVR